MVAQRGLAGNIPIPGNIQGEQTDLVEGDPAVWQKVGIAEFKSSNPNHSMISRQDFQQAVCALQEEQIQPNNAIPYSSSSRIGINPVFP